MVQGSTLDRKPCKLGCQVRASGPGHGFGLSQGCKLLRNCAGRTRVRLTKTRQGTGSSLCLLQRSRNTRLGASTLAKHCEYSTIYSLQAIENGWGGGGGWYS